LAPAGAIGQYMEAWGVSPLVTFNLLRVASPIKRQLQLL
jgi:hypothetical protein